jgi:hypothetical protein
MQPTCRIAFKEWSAVCAALAAGRQTLILRKGGIAEGPGGFKPEHAEFWLLPTRFHERPAALAEGDRHFFDEQADDDGAADTLPNDLLHIAQYATVADVIDISNERLLSALEPLHVYGPSTIHQRFHYRRPGLFLLAVRIYRAPVPLEIPIWPELAGCRSWVELPAALSTAGLQPAISDAEFAERLAEIRRAVE